MHKFVLALVCSKFSYAAGESKQSSSGKEAWIFDAAKSFTKLLLARCLGSGFNPSLSGECALVGGRFHRSWHQPALYAAHAALKGSPKSIIVRVPMTLRYGNRRVAHMEIGEKRRLTRHQLDESLTYRLEKVTDEAFNVLRSRKNKQFRGEEYDALWEEKKERAEPVYQCLQQELGLSLEEIIDVVKRYPALLETRIDVTVPPFLSGLRAQFGLGRPVFKRAVLFEPRVLETCTSEHVLPPLKVLQETCGMGKLKLKLFLLKNPGVFYYCTRKTVLPQLQERLGLNSVELERCITKFPNLLQCNFEPSIACLQNHGMSLEEVKRAVLKSPRLLTAFDSEDNMESAFALLQKELGQSHADFMKIVLSVPRILHYDLEGALPTLRRLRERVGLSKPELSAILVKVPTVLKTTSDQVLFKIGALQERLLLSNSELKQVLIGMPQLLNLNMAGNIIPKIDWLQTEIGLPLEHLRQFLLGQPKILSRSLDLNLRPRLEACRTAGVPVKKVLHYFYYPESRFYESIGLSAPSVDRREDVNFEETLAEIGDGDQELLAADGGSDGPAASVI